MISKHWASFFQETEDEVHVLKLENAELQRRVCGLQKKKSSLNTEQFILEGQEAYYKAVSLPPPCKFLNP